MIGFYMKRNTGLKWVKRENNEIASLLLGVIHLVSGSKNNIIKIASYVSGGKKC